MVRLIGGLSKPVNLHNSVLALLARALVLENKKNRRLLSTVFMHVSFLSHGLDRSLSSMWLKPYQQRVERYVPSLCFLLGALNVRWCVCALMCACGVSLRACVRASACV